MRMALALVSLVIVIWVIAWILFLRSVPAAPENTTTQTDAIVVLTGGSVRVEHGFERLSQGLAPRLLISGVGREITLDDLLKTHASSTIQQAIIERKSTILLDHIARSTRTNARETARFIHNYDIHSIRLITANYHMPRSLIEMRHALPTVTIIADPVFPKGFEKKHWLHYAGARKLLLIEFHKSWAVRLRHFLNGTHATASL